MRIRLPYDLGTKNKLIIGNEFLGVEFQANTITSLSSFGIFPIIGTFGQGYFQKGNRGVNPFATHIPNILSNIHQMEADVRGTGQMRGKSIENLIEWFVNDTAVA